MNDKICVLLSSYNGEKYIKEQIESILNQKDVDVIILIRDDGSKDSTVTIIQELCKSHNNIRLIVGANIGYINSFNFLVEYANKYYREIEYFAFSDQDDIWYNNKLKNAIDNLKQISKNEPQLYASNSMKVNAKGEDIGYFMNKEPIFNRKNVLRMQLLQGCSMVFNRRAIEIYADIPSAEVIHDRWMFMICFFLGVFIYDHTPQFAYRIHGGNAIGVSTPLSRKKQIYESVRYWTSKRVERIYHKANNKFIRDFEQKLSSEDLQSLRILTTYTKSFTNKIKLAFDKRFMVDPKAGLLHFFSHIIQVMFNKI